jgi:hypothetical protein
MATGVIKPKRKIDTSPYEPGDAMINIWRYTDAGKRETLPTKMSVAKLITTGQAAGAGLKLGMPKAGLDSLPGRVITEGRPDAGANEYDYNYPGNKKLLDAMHEMGLYGADAYYPIAYMDKARQAAQQGISVDHAYNGTGKNRETGKTGKDYEARMAATIAAPNDPKNAPLVDLIKRAATGKLTEAEKFMQGIEAFPNSAEHIAAFDKLSATTQENFGVILPRTPNNLQALRDQMNEDGIFKKFPKADAEMVREILIDESAKKLGFPKANARIMAVINDPQDYSPEYAKQSTAAVKFMEEQQKLKVEATAAAKKATEEFAKNLEDINTQLNDGINGFTF